MILIILYVILLCVYFACPLPVRLLILAVNFFIPDPIPIVDEVLMIAGIISKIIALDKILEFIEEHKILFTIIGLGIVILIVKLIF